ncbi:hypothetical protein ACOSQ2_030013 [Xanthoceras sorbifolium]
MTTPQASADPPQSTSTKTVRILRPCSPSLSSMTTPQASADPPQSTSTKTVRVAKSWLQRVCYRYWTIEKAGGFRTSHPGSPDSVQDMEQRCRRGPPDAMVTGLEVFPCNDDPGTGFERKRTV